MTLDGFKGTTYEVLTGDGSRWVIAGIHRIEKDARAAAEALLASGNHGNVRITAKRDGAGKESVIFEGSGQVKEKPLKPRPVPSAPLCVTVEDCLRHPARLAVGRVGREYLSERGITPLEFMTNAGELIGIERRDAFFAACIHQLAGAQTAGADMPEPKRAEVLFRLHGQLTDRVRRPIDTEAERKALAEKGASVLNVPAEGDVPIATLRLMADFLAYGGDWRGRLAALVALLETCGPEHAGAARLVDELIAELLDAVDAIDEILGGFRSGAEVCRTLSALATGGGSLPKFAHESAHGLHGLMNERALPATRAVLLDRVAAVLRGIRPLLGEGREQERTVFTAIVRLLEDPAGLFGGPGMAEAVTLRAKMALGVDEDLPIERAIERVTDLFPNRAVKLGFLLDLTASETGRKYAGIVLKALAALIGQLTSIKRLVAAGTSQELFVATIESLRGRLAMDSLPADVRDALARSLDKLLREEARPQPAPPQKSAGGKPVSSGSVQRRTVEKNGILFEAGDAGDEAYLIAQGSVEIFRRVGNREDSIAVLGRGEIIGEMSLIDKSPRMASARATQDTQLVVISEADLHRRMAALEETDRVLKLLMDTLVRRLRGQAKSST